MLKKDSRTNRVVVRLAEGLVNRNAMVALVIPAAEKSVSCLKPSARLVAKKRLYRLSPLGTDRYIAEIASRLDAARI